jgi:DNA polymerase III delta prime subunit
MNAASQNKLLKTLEEPTGSVYIIISAQNTENLLPTIKSRCRMLETGQFGEEDIYNYLICAGTDNKKAMTVSKICGGSLGKALDIISNENYINMYNFISGLFDKLQSYEDVLRCMEIFNAVEDKNAALDIMQMIFHDKMLRAAENDRKGKNNGYSVKSLICFIEKTSEAKRKLSLNCNPAAVIETLLIDIVEKGKEEQI